MTTGKGLPNPSKHGSLSRDRWNVDTVLLARERKMRTDSAGLEAGRLEEVTIDNYPMLHERHRCFPEVFEKRGHKKILDTSAGIGVTAKRIIDNYDCEMHCNEVDEKCRTQLKTIDVQLTSYDLDAPEGLPFEDESFDAIVCLATLEHLINIDEFTRELFRILRPDGRLYMTVPNYASLYWLIPILKGNTFHDPLDEKERYEFYAHIRYFTYNTLERYLEHFGFVTDTVYMPLPWGSTRMERMRQKRPAAAFLIRNLFRMLYHLSPRWHQEPIQCMSKATLDRRMRKVIL